MSKVVIAGDASGTGTFTISAPNGNTDRTLVLPDEAGTVLTTATAGVPVNGPAFSAYQSSAQTLSSATYTKIQLQTEEFDTASCFDSTTNYRFTPSVAGYYLFTGSIAVSSFVTQMQIGFFKNGSLFKQGFNSTGAGQASISSLIYLNGSTDYVELYAWLYGGQALLGGGSYTFFQAFLARSVT